MQAFTGIIRGRVQGVGFRYFTQRRAVDLNIRGWVRNLPEGTVEFLAIGEEEPLGEFLQAMKKGPPAGRVEQVDGTWVPDPPPMMDFQIR